MPAHFGSYPHHADIIICPTCGQKGRILWEEVPQGDSVAKEMAKLEGDFYERIARKAPYPIEIVCNGCGTPQTE